MAKPNYSYEKRQKEIAKKKKKEDKRLAKVKLAESQSEEAEPTAGSDDSAATTQET